MSSLSHGLGSRVRYPRRLLYCALFLVLGFNPAEAQFPKPALVGYLHNWNTTSAPYVPLTSVDTAYNVINVAFAIPSGSTDYRMMFVPEGMTPTQFLKQVKDVQAQGRIVNISVGGATAPVSLNTSVERDSFVVTMLSILDAYGFDGMDIDFEGSSLSVSGGSISAPVDAPVINLIDAIRTIMRAYHATHHKRMYLSMAPETAFIQGGQSAFSGIWGAYLPVIHALRDSIEILHVQLYNSGTMYGIDHRIYTQGSADFLVAMTEAVIRGFQTAGGFFAGLPAEHIAVGLPACGSAAGGGYTAPDTVKAAMRYLLGAGPRPGMYTLAQAGGYPSLRGMMTWSINWDATATCASVYEFARTFQAIYTPTVTALEPPAAIVERPSFHPNPARAGQFLTINMPGNIRSLRVHDILGHDVLNIEPAGAASSAVVTAPSRPGMYVVVVLTSDGNTRIGRILVVPDG
jgi:chitinase